MVSKNTRTEVTFGDIAALAGDTRLWGLLGRGLPPRLEIERTRRERVAIEKLIQEGYITPTTKSGLNYLTPKGKRARHPAWNHMLDVFAAPSFNPLGSHAK